MKQTDFIFLQIDPSSFTIASRAVTELQSQNRTRLNYTRRSSIIRVKSANNVNNLHFNNLYNFSRRVGACARLCMLDSLCLNPIELWNMKNFFDRNYNDYSNFHRDTMVGTSIQITPNEGTQYWSEYDRLYPHYVIERAISGTNVWNSNNFLASNMIIFRNNFTEIIQINTSIWISFEHQVDRSRNIYNYVNCSITVFTQHYHIGQGLDRKFTHLLKTMCYEQFHGRNNYGGVDTLGSLIVDRPSDMLNSFSQMTI